MFERNIKFFPTEIFLSIFSWYFSEEMYKLLIYALLSSHFHNIWYVFYKFMTLFTTM